MKTRNPLLLFIAGAMLLIFSSTAFGSAKNGYYHKDTGPDFMFYDAMARFGTPVVDGSESPGEWDRSLVRTILKEDKEDNRISILFQYDAANFYVFVEVDDDDLWDEPGTVWDTDNDDGIKLYIDPDNSRNPNLMYNDRYIAFSILKRHHLFLSGNNIGGYNGYGEISSLGISVGVNGTVNVRGDKDEGYLVEMAIPWTELGVTPSAFSVVSLNLFVLEDDQGGTLTPIYNGNAVDTPLYIDSWHKWFSRVAAVDEGARGPSGYARVSLLPENDSTAPARIADLSVHKTRPFSCEVTFTAPGDNGTTGEALAYRIRYAKNTPIVTEEDWNRATEFTNGFIPRIAGKGEHLRILGLSGDAPLHIAVRAEDYAGNLGPISNNAAVTLTSPPEGYGKGRIYPSPAGRYFLHEDGSPFLPVSQPAGITWMNIRELYSRPLYEQSQNILVDWSAESVEAGQAEAFISSLSEKGINLIRIFIEDLAFAVDNNPYRPDGVSYLEFPATADGSAYIRENLDFLDRFFTLCARYNIHVTLTPFDNYFYIDYWNNNPYNSANGGPINTPEEFVTSPEARSAQKKRLEVLNEVVKNHYNFFGWEVMNEWDNNTFAASVNGWEELRISWIKDLTAHLRLIDSDNMVYITHVINYPYHELKDFAFRSDIFDFVGYHNYSRAVDAPLAAGDVNPHIRPALDTRKLVRFYSDQTVDNRPIFDNEFGPIKVPSYGPSYDEADDNEYFHNIIWAELACGSAGMPLRWPTTVLEFRGPKLTEQMWDYQENMARFFTKTAVRFDTFAGETWNRNITLTGGAPQKVELFSFSDGKQGLVWLLQDTRVATGAVGGVSLAVDGLSPGTPYRLEFWDTRTTDAEIQASEQTASPAGTLTIAVPGFEKGFMMTFSDASPPPIVPPASPGFTLTTDSDNTVNLEWSATEGATGYTLYYAPYPSATTVGSIDMGTAVSFTFNGSGYSFYVAVTANNSAGSSAYSDVLFFDLK